MKIPNDIRWKSKGATLGEGGQAHVVVVTDEQGEFPGEYALKLLKRNSKSVAYERFQREVESIKDIDHPSIIKIVDHSHPDDEIPFYVMEYHPEAKSLRKLIETDSNPFKGNAWKSVMFFMRLVEACRTWESKDLVHRDLSPANVLVMPDESIKVIDFGLCQIEEGETITLSNEGVGTPYYMAPECESGSTGKVDIRADLYSIGKLLWVAVTGEIIFSRETPVFNAKSMKKLLPSCPMAWHLHHLFEKTIRHEREDRFSDASDAWLNSTRVKDLIQNGNPPLELIQSNLCPVCGWGELEEHERLNALFSNPNPGHGLFSKRCNHCGMIISRDYQLLVDNLNNRENLT